MAQYFGTSRTNYFLVKDEEAFKADMAQYPVHVITEERDGKTFYGILDNNEDGGGLAWSVYDEEAEDYVDVAWESVLGSHLAEGEVGILMEVGAEKYRYLSGWAVAFNNKNEFRRIDLTDIYELAKDLGTGITQAEY